MFGIEAKQRILHAKRINGSEYSLLGEYFQKEPNTNLGLRLVK
jgi:hypothetical protein